MKPPLDTSHLVTGDGKYQLCPRCGSTNAPTVPAAKCWYCTWRITWVGPLWGTDGAR